MRILLFESHKHRQKKNILASVVFCAQSKARISLQVSFPTVQNSDKTFPALPGPIFQVVFINSVFFLQLPQSTVKIGSSANKERGINTVLHCLGSIPGSPCLKSGDFPGSAGSQIWMLTLLTRRSGNKVVLSCYLFMLSCCSARFWSNTDPVFPLVLQGIL